MFIVVNKYFIMFYTNTFEILNVYITKWYQYRIIVPVFGRNSHGQEISAYPPLLRMVLFLYLSSDFSQQKDI